LEPEFHQTIIEEVKAGKIASSQRTLSELIARNPEDENAWLLLAATLNTGMRGYCLQQVLEINPENQEAQKLRSSSDFDILEVVNIRSNADNEDKVDEETRISYWYKFIDGSLQVAIMDDEFLHLAYVNRNQLTNVAEMMENGQLPQQMLLDYFKVEFNTILKTSHVNEKIVVDYKHKEKNQVEVFCRDKAEATMVFNELSRRLGPKFERKTEKIKNNSKIIVAFVFFILLAFLTLVLLFATFEISTGNLSLPLNDRSLYNLETYGPIGILLIGGLLMLLTFMYMVIQYIRPAKMITLEQDSSVAI